jgi:cytochrome bd-type quinol oxidase subunit 2
MRFLPLSPDIELAARQLKWMAAFQAFCWGALLVVIVGSTLMGLSHEVREQLDPDDLDWFFSVRPFLYVLALVPSALATTFAQQLRRSIAPSQTSEPATTAFGSVVLPFIVAAVVYGRLDRALTTLRPPAARTRGAWFAITPLWLLFLGPFVTLATSRHSEMVLLALFAASRVAWGAMTMRACRSILSRAALGSIRAHGDAPVAGG